MAPRTCGARWSIAQRAYAPENGWLAPASELERPLPAFHLHACAAANTTAVLAELR